MGVVSRRWVWLVGDGGIYGCGCKEVYRFPHIRRGTKNAKLQFFYFAQCISKLSYFSDIIHSFDWKSAVKYDGGV